MAYVCFRVYYAGKEILLILLGFKQAIVDAIKRIDDLAISKYELSSFDEITFVLSIFLNYRLSTY